MQQNKRVIIIVLMLNIFMLVPSALCFAFENQAHELSMLSIEELISIKVTSVMKTSQSLSETPAAIHVLTQEDIRRSGATNIPDLLRIVPGVQVAELDSNIFAVSIRGFNDIHANKLLVLVDGRTVYNNIFSGVIWSFLTLIMEDIDRIEIIRGPGSSVWGANAVNGVINIITKNSYDTEGLFFEFGHGTQKSVYSTIRYGRIIDETLALRFYSKGLESCRCYMDASATCIKDKFNSKIAGFRADWVPFEKDEILIQGDFTHSEPEKSSINEMRIIDNRSWNLLSRWNHKFSAKTETVFQMFYQGEDRKEDYQYDIFDVDFQLNYDWSSHQKIVWGLGYRFITDKLIKGLYGNYTYSPEVLDQNLFSCFFQDTFLLIPDKLSLSVGSKFDYNDTNGLEFQPGIRLSWNIDEKRNFWSAVSRSVRTPSRMDLDTISSQSGENDPKASKTQIKGKNVDSEDLISYEIGYRTKPLESLWFDIALFYNIYENLITRTEIEKNVWLIGNDMKGETYGIEVSTDIRPSSWCRFSAAWSLLEMDMHLKKTQAMDSTAYIESSNPRHQLSLHTAFTYGNQIELDIWMRYVDEIASMKFPFEQESSLDWIDSYTKFDVRLAWNLSKAIEISITGRNLGGSHQEFSTYEIEESVMLEITINPWN
jgi:iron complex outermembrane receptor protein